MIIESITAPIVKEELDDTTFRGVKARKNITFWGFQYRDAILKTTSKLNYVLA